MTNEISIFNFNENQVRTQLIHGEPWFCLSDCCGALEIKSSKDVVRQLPHKGAADWVYSEVLPTIRKTGSRLIVA